MLRHVGGLESSPPIAHTLDTAVSVYLLLARGLLTQGSQSVPQFAGPPETRNVAGRSGQLDGSAALRSQRSVAASARLPCRRRPDSVVPRLASTSAWGAQRTPRRPPAAPPRCAHAGNRDGSPRRCARSKRTPTRMALPRARRARPLRRSPAGRRLARSPLGPPARTLANSAGISASSQRRTAVGTAQHGWPGPLMFCRRRRALLSDVWTRDSFRPRQKSAGLLLEAERNHPALPGRAPQDPHGVIDRCRWLRVDKLGLCGRPVDWPPLSSEGGPAGVRLPTGENCGARGRFCFARQGRAAAPKAATADRPKRLRQRARPVAFRVRAVPGPADCFDRRTSSFACGVVEPLVGAHGVGGDPDVGGAGRDVDGFA